MGGVRCLKGSANQSWARVLIFIAIMALPVLSNPKANPGRRDRQSTSTGPLASQWEKPQPGWIYVLDSNGMRNTSQILLVSPAQKAVVGHIPAGYAPDMALSPDGKYLYVSSGAPGVISVVRTDTGNVIGQFAAGDRLVQLLFTMVPELAVSPNNRWLSLMNGTGESPESSDYNVALLDTSNGTVLSRTSLRGCGVGRLVWVNDSKLLIHCLWANSIITLNVNASGEVVSSIDTSLATIPVASDRPFAGIVVLPDQETAALITSYAGVTAFNLSTHLPKGAEAKKYRRISFKEWPRSSDGRKIYIGSSPSPSSGEIGADEIEVFDTVDWQYTAAIKTSVPFFSATVSKDDRYLYAISMSRKRVLVIDLQTMQEVGGIENVGTAPTLAAVAP